MVGIRLYGGKQSPDSLRILDNLSRIQVALPKYAIHECNGHLTHCVPKGTSAYHHFHLENVAARDSEGDDVLQHRDFVQAERAREVADSGTEHGICEEVGSAGDKFALEIPTVDTARGSAGHKRARRFAIPCASDNVEVMSLL